MIWGETARAASDVIRKKEECYVFKIELFFFLFLETKSDNPPFYKSNWFFLHFHLKYKLVVYLSIKGVKKYYDKL